MIAFLLENGSYLAFTFILLMTGFGLPVPEEVPVVVAGVLASHGQLKPWLAFVACLVGILGGDCAIYGIGRSKLFEYARDGKLQPIRCGTKTLWLRSDLARLLAQLRGA